MSRVARSYSQSKIYHILIRGINKQNILRKNGTEPKLSVLHCLKSAKKRVKVIEKKALINQMLKTTLKIAVENNNASII